MNTEELDKLRVEDIEFFARRYSELFGKHFDKNTSQEKEEFYKEIKEELLEKAPRYVAVDNDPIHGAQGRSYADHIELSESSGAIGNRAIRIHELFHSYNNMEDRRHGGLRDFDDDLVLKNLDEGSTEMFAQMMCGNESQDTGYINEVKLSRFLTSIVGERTMIRATRGNPQLLCETTDQLLGTQDFLQKLEELRYKINELVRQSYGEDCFLGRIIEDKQLLSQLKLETIRGKDDVSMLLDAIEQSGNQELHNNISRADHKFGYNVFFYRSFEYNSEFDSQQPTLASVQQDILKAEIDELDKVEEISLQTVLEMEIKKFLYDRISYQKHFLDHTEPEYDEYELTPQDIEFSEDFRSDLDGASERFGGRIGLEGPGSRVYSLENTPYMINENMLKRMYLPGFGFDELQDFRLELWAEKLNIAQIREFLNKWTVWIDNVWYKKMFPDGEEKTFYEAIEGIRRTLDEKEQGLRDKYTVLESEKQQETDTKKDDFIGSSVNEENPSEIEETLKQKGLKTDEFEDILMQFEEILILNDAENENKIPIEQTQIEGDTSKQTLKEQNEDKSLSLWMNRFNGWYSAIDRVSQSVKNKFVKMKSDIIKAISEKLKERNNHRQVNTQEQDTNER